MKFPRLKPGILSVCGIVAASVVAYFAFRSPGVADRGRESQGAPPAPPVPTLDSKVSQRAEDPAQEPRPPGGIPHDETTLKEIKRRWLALKAIHPSVGMSDEDVAEREKLAIESLRLLKLSAGAFELDAFLRQNQILINRNGWSLLGFFSKTLKEDPALIGEMKASFLKALRDATGKAAGDRQLQASMVRMLAEYGNDSDFESYHQSLKEVSPGLARDYLLSRSVHLVKGAPDKLAGVIESSLQRLNQDGGLQESDRSALVQVVLHGGGGSAAQFEATLQVLNRFSGQSAKVDLSPVKDAVVSQWAQKDPVHVTELVLGDSDLYSDELMRSLGARGWRVLESEHGIGGVLNWLDSIPDDAAKRSAIRGAALSKAAGYLEGGRGPEIEGALAEARQISNLLPAAERKSVFEDFPALAGDQAPADKK